jgi:hypothetical protein
VGNFFHNLILYGVLPVCAIGGGLAGATGHVKAMIGCLGGAIVALMLGFGDTETLKSVGNGGARALAEMASWIPTVK